MEKYYERVRDRCEELQHALAQPDAAADPQRYQGQLRELAALTEQAQAWERYRQTLRRRQETAEMLEDPELAEMARLELEQTDASLAAQREDLLRGMLPKDPDDERNAVLEIRPGAGGEESALFAADLARMYEHFALRKGWQMTPVSLTATELGGLKEAVFTLSGRGVWAGMKYEQGVHRVQRVPVTESSGRKQTSTCTVAVLPEAEEVEVQLDPKDLRIDTYRASGAGGQYVNRTDSAVRITHLPTGIVATCQDEKSQLKNREQAMKVLRARILQQMREASASAMAQARRQQVGTGDRSERIRTYNFHEGRVTDHRIDLTLYRIQDIMDGDLEEIVTALRRAEEQKRLAQLTGQTPSQP